MKLLARVWATASQAAALASVSSVTEHGWHSGPLQSCSSRRLGARATAPHSAVPRQAGEKPPAARAGAESRPGRRVSCDALLGYGLWLGGGLNVSNFVVKAGNHAEGGRWAPHHLQIGDRGS